MFSQLLLIMADIEPPDHCRDIAGMKPLVFVSLFALAFIPACGTTPAEPATAGSRSVAEGINLNMILGGVRDKGSAEASKSTLERAVAAIQETMRSNPGVVEASGGMKKISLEAATKFGVTKDTLGTIKKLLNDPAISSVIGPVLTQLKDLL